MSAANKLLQHKSDGATASSPGEQTAGITLPAGTIPPPGTVVFDSTGQQYQGTFYIHGNAFGQSFTTGGTIADLTDLKLELSSYDTSDGGSISVELWSDGGGLSGPGTDLGTLATINDSQLSNTATVEDISLLLNPTLAASTRYWIVLQGNGANSAGWCETSDLSGTEAANELNLIFGTVSTDTGDSNVFGMAVTTDTCFAEGTRILTEAGELPVESLRPGDRVMALRRGGFATVRWVGCRPVNLRRHPNRERLDPVRIQKDAFAPGVPQRDLFVSPDHALYIDGALVTVRYLLNGATIAQTTPNEITYYHVELDSHDVLLAENLPAESFLDIGNKAAFANGGKPIQVHPEFSRETWDARACAPGLVTMEQRAPVRDRLRARVPELGYVLTSDADLRIQAGTNMLLPTLTGNLAHVTLPPGTDEIQILSRTASPKHFGPEHADGRRLGIGVARLTLDSNDLPLDHSSLASGWHAPEPQLRWTNGTATLRTEGATNLELHLLPGLKYWREAEASARQKAA